MVQVIIKKGSSLSNQEVKLMNLARKKEFGTKEIKDFKKDYPLDSNYFFVLDKKIVAFGILIPISIDYLGKKYKIMGICSIISLKKGKGYGKILIQAMISYLKKTNKTGLGFTTKTKFFKKAGLKTKKNFIKKFVYVNPKTKEKVYDNEGDGIYLEGKDKFISKVINNKSKVFINIIHW